MKKIIALVLTVVMVGSLAACGGNSGSETKATEATKAKTETQSESKTDSAAPETDGAQATEATEGTDAADETEAGSDAAGETTADNAGSNTLIMGTEAGFAPYEYTEDGETVIGVDVDIANEIAKAMGKELKIQNMTFDAALLAVQQGKVDFAAAGISVTEDRKASMDFSIEYATSKQVVVVNKEAMAVKSVDEITDENIVGVQTGNVADGYCTDQGWNVKQYNKFLEAAMDLKNDKIDCIVMDSLPAEQMVAANSDLLILDGELFTDKYAIAVQKGNTELLDQINAVLQKLMDEGKIDEYTINHTTK